MDIVVEYDRIIKAINELLLVPERLPDALATMTRRLDGDDEREHAARTGAVGAGDSCGQGLRRAPFDTARGSRFHASCSYMRVS